MDKDTIYNTVSGAVGACLAIIFFLILFGRIDLLGLVEEGSLGKATRIFETRYLSAADAKAHASRFIDASPRALEQEISHAARDLGLPAIVPSDMYIHSTFRHNGGRCVRIGIVDDDTTMQAGRVYLFVDRDGIVHVENDC